MAISTQVNNDLYKRALSDADKKRLAQIAQTQGAGAASSLALQMANTATETRTPPLPTGGATTGGAVPAQVQTAQAQAQAMRAQQEQQRAFQQAQKTGDIQTANQILRAQAQQQNIQSAQQSGNTQAAAQIRQAAEAEARAAALNSGNQQQINEALRQQTPYQAAVAAATPVAQPVQMKDYLVFGSPAAGFQSGMSGEDQARWDAIGKKYAAGDTSWNTDTNEFRENGNWSSYYDSNGNINGWLYAGDGVGGYAPVFGGKVGETGYKPGTVFYSPDGKAYTMGADGTLAQSGNVEWAKYGSYVGPKTGYQDSSFWALEDGQYKKYTNQTAPDSVLEAQGYYRDSNGLVMPINDDYYIAQGLKNGQITPEQVALAQAVRAQGNNPQPLPDTQPTAQSTQPVQSAQPVKNTPQYTQAPQPTQTSPQATPVNYQPVQTQPTQPATNNQNAYQRYLDQWEYPDAPEWNGTEYERQRDAALEAAQNMRWDGSEYQTERDRLLEEAMRPYEGSPYDQQRDDALAQYGEKWQGSEYQPRRDAALERAENMQWNYDPNTDPVWQALQKQYRREGDRATQEAMAQAAMRTGGLANSYAVTAASQAGDYYAAQLSDRLPQLYQDAYQRYLQEFQRQMGISDQYQGFDDREYSRWADQQGKNLDLADRYNQYGQQDYNQYRDRVSQQLSGADRYNGYDQTEYQRYLDQYGRQLDAADRYNQYGAIEYDRYRDQLGQYNTDRDFSYGRYRDAVGDYRYDDETQYNRAWNEEARDYNRAYQAQRDAILDNRADREWAQQLREYADAQNWKATEWEQYLREYGDQLSEKQRQWAYQMARDAVEDNRWERQYSDQRGDTMYERALQEDQTAYQRALQADALAYDRQQDELDREYKQNAFQASLDQWQAEYDADQNNTEYNRAMNRWKLYGTVQPGDEAILGAPAGTAYPTTGGSTGGGYSGGGDGGKTPEDKLPDGQYRQNGYIFLKGKTHPQGQPMTAMYEQAYKDTQKKWNTGMDYALLIAEVTNLKINKSITDYEGQMILNDLRKWKAARDKSATLPDVTKGEYEDRNIIAAPPKTQQTR